jgi:hypothetical protein
MKRPFVVIVPLLAVTPFVGACTGTAPALTAHPAASGAASHLPEVVASGAGDAHAVMAEAERLGSQDLWPDFDPSTVPVAIYNGRRTLLFRHPSPPEGFVPLAGEARVFEYPGRHSQVSANTSIDLGGVRTATLMPVSGDASVRERAALLIHEIFHVHQREHHPSWSANEVDLFTYPVDRLDVLALRRLESHALRHALRAADPELARCWTREALSHREARFDILPEASATYERRSELNEGLATYVEHRALATEDAEVFPSEGFPVDAVRQRSYWSGLALARLLDRFRLDWRNTLAADDSGYLDRLLAEAVAGDEEVPRCGVAAEKRAVIEARAERDIHLLQARREDVRADFLGAAGWRLVIVADGAPLFPQGFDPLNVETLRQGEVLHRRFLQLGNELGNLELMGRAALSTAAGEHPLFNGVRAVTITGLDEDVVREVPGAVAIEGNGIVGEFRAARVERDGTTVRVYLR